MSLFKPLRKGAVATASAYKLIFIIWLTLLVLTVAVSFPLRLLLSSMFGSSMTVELLRDGFDVAVAGDMMESFRSLMVGMIGGGMLLGTVGFFLMTFFAGGLFRRFTMPWGGLKISDFLRASSYNFWPFLKIAVVMMIIIALFTALVLLLPAGVFFAKSVSTQPVGKVVYLFYLLWLLGMPILLFVADAARSRVAATGRTHTFRAIAAGFRTLKKRFLLSYGAMVLVLLVNLVVVLAILWIAAVAMPYTAGGVFLLFLAFQLLFILRLFTKAWRYAAVCSMTL